ncbi:unnamed protein product [Spirodela intermedia]|uniref:NAD(P)-binding domain-containing protein n=1 Tax=Spirodela intermedia TaxID=51605 RepID=A0A7I8IWR5_SPIIN|nr:unnamed protein product [Spirodela intermedia]CAA6662260.1 unnamed protein product [Spirodela intermedia]
MTFCPGTERYKTEVCVLDASSYVGFWILKKLLSKGYKVHAGLRRKEETTTVIREMWKSDAGKKTLSLFTVDVLDYQTILTSMNGCSALFCSLDSQLPTTGVFNVVEACARTPSVEKLIFSSSLAAGIWSEDLQTLRQVDERCWSDVEYCRKLKLWYPVAKTLSERTAWGLASDRMLNMVSVNAALVIGPDVAVQNPVSTLSYLKGAEKMQESGVLASVDVDFLADVHVSALEDPSANGRYFCFNNVVRSEEESVKLAKRLTPLIQIPPRYVQMILGKHMIESCQRKPKIYDIQHPEDWEKKKNHYLYWLGGCS